jgi:hypothetical protein
MLSWLCFAVSVFKPIEFGPQPPMLALARGRELYAQKEPLDRALQGSREVLGRWFSGSVHKEADIAVWLSPNALARWYGYLAARDAWTQEMLKERWADAAMRLKGKVVFLVRLAAFPREDPLEFGTGKDADPKVLEGLRFRVSYRTEHREHYTGAKPATDGDFVLQSDGTYAAASAGKLEASFEKREPSAILDQPFFHLSSVASLFLDAGESDEADDGIPLGGYYGAVYLVTFDRPKSLSLCRQAKFEVVRRHKVSSVTFSLLEPLPERHHPDPWAPRRTISVGSIP